MLVLRRVSKNPGAGILNEHIGGWLTLGALETASAMDPDPPPGLPADPGYWAVAESHHCTIEIISTQEGTFNFWAQEVTEHRKSS